MKQLIRAKDRVNATAARSVGPDLDSPEGWAVRYLTQERRNRFPLLFHLVEEVYGPSSDAVYPPDQTSRLRAEIISLDESLAKTNPSDTIFHPLMDGLTVGVIRAFLKNLLGEVDAALENGENLYAFGD